MNAIEQGFMDDFAKSPNDRTLRLIYADYLEDIGEAQRAVAMRLLIERNFPVVTPGQAALAAARAGAGG
jgi:uncharacterized protein (TIGR02996 family)